MVFIECWLGMSVVRNLFILFDSFLLITFSFIYIHYLIYSLSVVTFVVVGANNNVSLSDRVFIFYLFHF